MNLQQQLIAYKTIVIREFLRFIRIWLQTVLPPVITTALYFIIFGNLIGSQIGDMHGFSYMNYITPGLIMMAIITNSYANVVSSFFGTKFHHNIEEMLISPLPNYIIILGFISGGLARGMIVGLAVSTTAMLFADIHLHSILITVSIAMMTSVLFALAGLLNGIYAKSFDDISIVPTFVLTPLTYLGGIFYSIDMLPEFWQNVSLINPILYMINAFRYGLLGVSDINLALSYAITLGFILGLYSFALYLLNKGHGIRS